MNRALLLVLILSNLAAATRMAKFDPEASDGGKDEMIRCAIDAIKTSFLSGTSISILMPQKIFRVNLELANRIHEEILKTGKWSVIITKVQDIKVPKWKSLRPQYVIMFASTNFELEVTMRSFGSSAFWSPYLKYLVLTRKFGHRFEILSQNLMQTLWNYQIDRVVFQSFEPATNVSKFWTLLPDQPTNNCGNTRFNYFQFSSCSNKTALQNSVNFFSVQLQTNLNKCPLLFGAAVYPPYVIRPRSTTTRSYDNIRFTDGIEIELINLIASRMNFTPRYKMTPKEEDWGKIYSFSWKIGSSLMGMLIRKEVDCAVGGLTPDLRRKEFVDSTRQYSQENIIWVVPARVKHSSWSLLTHLFSVLFSVYISIVFWWTALVTYLVMKFSRASTIKRYKRFKTVILFSLFSGIVSNPLHHIPPMGLIRFIFGLWFSFSLIWHTSFKGFLISNLMKPLALEQIKNADELLNLNLTLGISQSTLTYLEQEHHYSMEIYRKINESLQICESTLKCLEKVANSNDFAVAVSSKYYRYVKDNFVDSRGYPLLGTIKKKVVTAPLEMICTKRHPLLKQFNYWIYRATESGFIQRWEKAFKYKNNVRHATVKEISENLQSGGHGTEPLKWVHFKGIAVLYFACVLICCVVFSGEIIWNLFNFKSIRARNYFCSV